MVKKNGENNPNFGKHHSEEAKKRMSELMTGRGFTEEHRKKLSEANIGKKSNFYGKHHSEDTKRKISESHGVNGILQFSKDGEFIAEYPSTKEAERQTGCNSSHICQCCKGKRKSAGGFIWKYKE